MNIKEKVSSLALIPLYGSLIWVNSMENTTDFLYHEAVHGDVVVGRSSSQCQWLKNVCRYFSVTGLGNSSKWLTFILKMNEPPKIEFTHPQNLGSSRMQIITKICILEWFLMNNVTLKTLRSYLMCASVLYICICFVKEVVLMWGTKTSIIMNDMMAEI